MKTTLKALFGIAAACAVCAAGQPANAGELVGGWNYGIDSFRDGSGGSKYDIKGMAIKETEESVFVALTGGTPLDGVKDNRATGGYIGWGDLFFNFSDDDFATALANGDVLGVNFAPHDGGGERGVYQVDSLKGIGKLNRGYKSMKQYFGWAKKKASLGTEFSAHNKAGKTAVYKYLYGSEAANSPNHKNTKLVNVIDEGSWLGGIDLLGIDDLKGEGLNFGLADGGMFGTQTFGFKFSRDLLPSGEYLAHLFLECGNDSIALAGELDEAQETPEPTSWLGAIAVGLTMAGSRLRKRTRA